jgi:hypothetical protein
LFQKGKKKSLRPRKTRGGRATTILIKNEKEKKIHAKCGGRGDTTPAVTVLVIVVLFVVIVVVLGVCSWAVVGVLAPSAPSSPSPSPFPPHEQLLAAAVGGAVVIAVVVVVVVVMVVEVVVMVVMVVVMVVVVVSFISPSLSPAVAVLFLVVGLRPLTLPRCLCRRLSSRFVVVLIHYPPREQVLAAVECGWVCCLMVNNVDRT